MAFFSSKVGQLQVHGEINIPIIIEETPYNI
jgi:hypothetical protein